MPTVLPDIPVTSVFLFLFSVGAAAHMAIFQLNKKISHRFIFSIILFGKCASTLTQPIVMADWGTPGFCMCRITTMVLRIVWATRQRNVKLGIAAQVFVAAGTVLLYIINIIFAQRLVRAQHPRLGWHKAFRAFFALVYLIIVLTLALLIFANIQTFFTLDPDIHHIDRIIQLYGLTFYAAVSFLPISLVILGFIIPRRARLEKFGSGRFRIKIFVLVSASLLLCLGASWRAGTAWLPPVPRSQSPWYLSKPCFYIFNFTVEVLVVLLYAILRVDRRFHVPNGAATTA